MKTCKICNIEKPLTDFPSSGFYTRNDGTKGKSYKPECKPCLVNKQSQRYSALWNKYFECKCSRCGYDKCQSALELHHLNGEDKDFTFASRYSISESRFAEESKKCVVLCANCHRELHAELMGD